MNNVDIFDQLAHYYNMDGMGWRDELPARPEKEK
jgi:hypothetical protein